MARPTPDTDYADALTDPEAQAAVARVFADNAPTPPPPPPAEDHPIVSFAKQILAPMYGQQNIGNVPRAGVGPYAGPMTAQGQALTSDTDTPPAPPQPFYSTPQPSVFDQIGGAFNQPGSAVANFDPNILPGYRGSPASRGETITGNINKQLEAADAARTEAANRGDVLGVAKGILGTVGAVSPQPPPSPFTGDPNEPGISEQERQQRLTAQTAWYTVAGLFGGGEGAAKGPLAKAIAARTPQELASAWNELPEAARTNPAVVKQIQDARANQMGQFRSGFETDEKTATAMAAGGLKAAQIEALRRGGATDTEIGDFTKMMAPVPEPRVGITSAEGQAIDPSRLTRALQTAAGTEGVPLSQHPVFADYRVEGAQGPKVAASHGGDIGTATRAVMAADRDAIDLLGPKLTQELIQNKIADILRKTGAPEETIRRGLGLLVSDGTAADATPAAVVAAGRKAEVAAAFTVQPATDYAPLIAAMRASGATEDEIAAYVGRGTPAGRAVLATAPSGEAARPGELFPGVRGAGQEKIVTRAELAAARQAAIAEGRVPPALEPPSGRGVNAAPTQTASAQPPFGPERMPGDIQPPRQPMLRTGLVPHTTDAVRDPISSKITQGRPVTIDGRPVMQAELAPRFGAGDATVPTEPLAFPQEPIRATYNPRTGEFVTTPKDADALAEQMRIQFPKDAPPKTIPVTVPGMASAMFRNYIVSNALSPFTVAIKAGADIIKTADTTLETVTQGVRTGRPAEIPGSVMALYGGFWRGITQDAVAAFKSRSYALSAEGVETKTRIVDQMLSGALGPGAKRFAQAGEVLSLGSPIPRTISALTAVFQRGYRDMSLYQEGYRLAANQKLTGAAADQYASQFMARPTDFIGGRQALEKATAEANTRTWTNSNPLSRIPGRDKPVLGDALFTITPFVNLVTNIAREGLEYIPGVGLAAKGTEAFMKGGKITSAEWTRVVQHQFMGAAGTVILGQKAAVGEITGDGPDDDNRRFAMIDQGWKPNHTKIGDNWYPNIAFGPIAPLLNAIGNTHDNLVFNTPASQRDSAIATAGSALNGLIKGELDSAHWLNSLMDLSAAVKGTDADKQNFVARWLGLFTPQSGSLKEWEKAQESNTPSVDPHLSLEDAIGQRYWRQYPPALRPADMQQLTPGTPRSDTGLAAIIPYLGTPGGMANLDGAGVPEGDPRYQSNPFLQTAQDIGQKDPAWRKGGVIESPSPNIGSGQEAIRLDPASAQAYIALVGQMRDRVIGATIYSTDFQNAMLKQQEGMFDAALTRADDLAKSQFLAKHVIDATDAPTIVAQAVAGFRAQHTTKDQAYWIALLDRAGKLTPDVVKAIDETARKEPLPGQAELITVAEYRKAAPLVHQFLAHPPYGTDAHPIGTPQDWQAVKVARQQKNQRVFALTEQGARPDIADHMAQVEALQHLTPIQRNIFVNSAAMTNPARRTLVQKYGRALTRFLGSTPEYKQESDAAYTQFPLASNP